MVRRATLAIGLLLVSTAGYAPILAGDPVRSNRPVPTFRAGGGTCESGNSAPAVRISAEGVSARFFSLSPDGLRVVQQIKTLSENIDGLDSVVLPAVPPNSLFRESDPRGSVWERAVDSLSSTVFFRAADYGDSSALYRLPIDGGLPVRLTEPLDTDVAEYMGVGGSWVLSQDDEWLVYLFTTDDPDEGTITKVASVAAAGGIPRKINAPRTRGGNVFDFAVSSDGSRVVYRGDLETRQVRELYSVPIEGGSSTKLNDSPVNGGGVLGYAIDPNAMRVVFIADQDVDDRFELYSVPIDGGTVTELSDALVDGGDVVRITISPDGTTVVFVADAETNGVDELFAVPIGGGVITKLSRPLTGGGDVTSWEIDASATTVVYRADADAAGTFALFAVPLVGGISIPLDVDVSGSGVGQFELSPSGDTVFYTAERMASADKNLWQVAVGFGGLVQQLNESQPVDDFRVAATGARVAYIVGPRLHERRVDGGSPTELTPPDTPEVEDFAYAGDGETVVFQRQLGTVFEVWVGRSEPDGDTDGVPFYCDCADDNESVYPGAAEINDGVDNQCPGDPGYGVADETQGNSGFHDPDSTSVYSWTAQPGATSYQVARATSPTFAEGCQSWTVADTRFVGQDSPVAGQTFFYLNRPTAPFAGSWGLNSFGVERFGICP